MTAPAFAWVRAIRAAEKGDNTLLDAHMKAGTLSPQEQEYIRVFGYTPLQPNPGGPHARMRVVALNESAEVARAVLLFSNGYQRGLVADAEIAAAKKHRCSVSTVKKHVRVAKRIWEYEENGKRIAGWWEYNREMIRKGKRGKMY
jgi:hypothetical protein